MIAEVLTNSDAISIYLIFPIPSYAGSRRKRNRRIDENWDQGKECEHKLHAVGSDGVSELYM